MGKRKTPKLELQKWYNTRQGFHVMLVLAYPWYHFRRLVQGYHFRDDMGMRRRKDGRLKRWGKTWGDIVHET